MLFGGITCTAADSIELYDSVVHLVSACADGVCDPPLEESFGVCQFCGASGQRCCFSSGSGVCAGTSAQPGRLVDENGFNPCSTDNTCVLCGNLDEPCCTIEGREACGADNLTCGRGNCDACGEDQQTCCDGDVCAGEATCVQGTCMGAVLCSLYLFWRHCERRMHRLCDVCMVSVQCACTGAEPCPSIGNGGAMQNLWTTDAEEKMRPPAVCPAAFAFLLATLATISSQLHTVRLEHALPLLALCKTVVIPGW